MRNELLPFNLRWSEVGPLRRLPRHADHPEGALAFADLAAVLIDHTRRRARESRSVPHTG